MEIFKIKKEWKILDIKIPGEAKIGRGVTLLSNGEVFMTGGGSYGSNNKYYSRTELFNHNTNSFLSLKSIPEERYNAEAQILKSGNILVFGGYANGIYFDNSFIFNYERNEWIEGPKLDYIKHNNLKNGDVIFFGGHNGQYLNKVWVYKESLNIWVKRRDFPDAVFYSASVLLPNEKVLIVGGQTENGFLSSAYLYDNRLDSYTKIKSPPETMRGGFLEVLDNGYVVYGGGQLSNGEYSTRVSYYDIENESWDIGGFLPEIKAFGDSVVLNNGNLLIFGGNSDSKTQSNTIISYGN